MKRVAAAAIIVIIVAGAVSVHLYRNRSTPQREIVMSGTVEVTTVDLGFRIPGRLKTRLVDEGNGVRKGEQVATLENEDQRGEVAIRQAEVDAAKAALAELKAGSRKEEIAQAESAAEAARSEAQRLADDYRRQEALYSKEIIPRREYEAARAARDSSGARAREAGEALSLVKKGPRKEKIDQANARERGARESLALARNRLDYTILTSPLSGIVLSKNAEPGEQLAAGTPVITIGDPSQTWIRAYVNETDLGRVRPGQKVKITADTWPDRVYDGTLSFIASEAEFTPKNVQTEKERTKLVYRVKITVSNPAWELKPGMPVTASIAAAE